MKTKHLTPALSPFCSADSAKCGEGETLTASCPILQSDTRVVEVKNNAIKGYGRWNLEIFHDGRHVPLVTAFGSSFQLRRKISATPTQMAESATLKAGKS